MIYSTILYALCFSRLAVECFLNAVVIYCEWISYFVYLFSALTLKEAETLSSGNTKAETVAVYLNYTVPFLSEVLTVGQLGENFAVLDVNRSFSVV
jgi:hypothetical protein